MLLNKTELTSRLILDSLAEADVCRNFNLSIKLFNDLDWRDFRYFPAFDKFHGSDRAELLLLAGKFLLYYGKAANLGLEDVGQEVLGEAKRIFQRQEMSGKAIECEIYLSIVYLHRGALDEYEVVLTELEFRTSANQDYLYLLVQSNLLLLELTVGRNEEALGRIYQVQQWIGEVDDVKTKISFLTQAGLILRNNGNIAEGLWFLEQSYSLAAILNNRNYQAMILNCQANTYRVGKDFINAERKINAAMMELPLDSKGWLGHFLDTQANIYLDQERYEEAVLFIEDALAHFRHGTDYLGLVESLWTYIQIQIKTQYPLEALTLFLELNEIATNFISEKFAFSYRKRFANQISFEIEGNIYQKVRHYKKNLLVRELETAVKKIEIAKKLGISFSSLYKMLKHEFPELWAEFYEN